mmetsp:Transcript_5249/g.16646  ORF Transcript_5249/g.16646 Transcript_5249/m.16646 type:complete len:216 (-) Transcript_5249:681-1328(-)
MAIMLALACASLTRFIPLASGGGSYLLICMENASREKEICALSLSVRGGWNRFVSLVTGMPIARLSASRTGPAAKSSDRMRACDCERAAVVEQSAVLPGELARRVDDHFSGRRSRSEFSKAAMPSMVDSCMNIEGSSATWFPEVSLYLPRYSFFSDFFRGGSRSAPWSRSCCVTLSRDLRDTRSVGSSTTTLLDHSSIEPSFISRRSAMICSSVC